MLRRSSPPAGILPALALLALLQSSCDSTSAPDGADAAAGTAGDSAVARVELAPVRPWGAPPASTVERFAPPEQLEAWSVTAADPSRLSLSTTDEGERVLAIGKGAGTIKLRIPHKHVPSEYDRVRIWCETRGFVRVGIQAQDRKGAWHTTPYGEANGLPDPLPVEVELAFLRKVVRKQGAVEVVIQHASHDLLVHGVELVRTPARAFLADPAGGPAHMALGDDSRACSAVLAGHPLEGVLERGAGVQRLEMDLAAAPVGAAGDARRATVVATRNGEVVGQLEVADLGAAWRPAVLDVAPGPGPLRVEVSTDAEDGVLVTPPRYRAGAAPSGLPGRDVVLWITSDTQRADAIGYAGGPPTPFLDGLAARGTAFLDATSVSTITLPSHASMFTGLSPRDTAIHGNLAPLSARARTAAEHFAEAGYRTFAAVSASHLVPSRSGLGQGFERFDGPQLGFWRDGARTVAAAEAMLAAAEGERVFLWLHLFDVHAPYRPHGDQVEDLYQGDPYDERLPELPPEFQAQWDRRIRDLKYIQACYRTEASYVNELVEGLFERTPRLGEALVAYTADHGESLGDQGNYWTHTPLYPCTVRVPLFLAGAGVPSGRLDRRRVSNLDVARTLLEACGIPGAEDFPGRSLLDDGALAESDAEPRYFVGAHGNAAAIELDGWFLLLRLSRTAWTQPPGAAPHGVELYRVAEDPSLETELSDQEHERARRMREALVAWLAEAPEGGGLAEDSTSPEARAIVAALGYAADESSSAEGALMDANCRCGECIGFRQ